MCAAHTLLCGLRLALTDNAHRRSDSRIRRPSARAAWGGSSMMEHGFSPCGETSDTSIRPTQLHAGYGLLQGYFIGVKMEKTDDKRKKRIELLVALAIIGGFVWTVFWAIFTYIVPPKNDTEKVEPPTIIPIPASGENTTIQPHITGENNQIDIDNSRDKTTIHASQVIMPDSRKSREWQIPDNDNNNAISIKLLERERDGIDKLKEEISQKTQSINNLPQDTCQEKNVAIRLRNELNKLETELASKEKNYNQQASKFNLPLIPESNPLHITKTVLDCE